MDKLDLALDEVRIAMNHFMDALDQEIENGKSAALPEDKIKSKLVAYIAIKDSGRIYLDWAEHYIEASFRNGEEKEESTSRN